jgi:hypothetical protein
VEQGALEQVPKKWKPTLDHVENVGSKMTCAITG